MMSAQLTHQSSYSINESRLVTTIDRITLEYGSLKSTLNVLIDTAQLEAAAHLADTLNSFWVSQNFLDEGSYWLNRILNHEEIDQLSPLLRGKLLVSASHLTRHRSEYREARMQFEEIRPFTVGAEYRLSASTLSGLGEIAFRQGHYDKAAEYYQQYLAVSEEDQAYIANAVVALGRIAGAKGNFQLAQELYAEGAAICKQIGYQKSNGWALNALGEFERTNMNFDRAAALFTASRELFQKLRNHGASMVAQQNLAFTLLAKGEIARPEQLFAQIVPTWQRGPTKFGLVLCLIGLAWVAEKKRDYIAAAKMLGTAETLLINIEARLELTDQHTCEIIRSNVEQALGHERYREAYESGTDMTPNEALALAGLSNSISYSGYPNHLTTRETQVLALVAEGQTDKQIAHRLMISPYTVNVHLRAIYRKLGANSRTSAIHLARSQSLL